MGFTCGNPGRGGTKCSTWNPGASEFVRMGTDNPATCKRCGHKFCGKSECCLFSPDFGISQSQSEAQGSSGKNGKGKCNVL
ncbi:hypothetical protein J1614_006978 [Plenodomus biglobosus]|nr:hypothetical protein J1614_006978 [Plenodomus biglobosus]